MTDCSGRCRARQQQSVRKVQEQANANLFFNALTDECMFEKIESLLPEYRERIYTPTDTLSMFLSQALNADRSCQHAVDEWFMIRQAAGLSAVSINTGAYCRARQRLPTEMISELVRHSGRELHRRLPDRWKWKGRDVKMADGTTLSMPDTPENQLVYPQPNTQEAGVGFPLCRLLGLLDLSSGGVIDVAFGPCEGKGSGEQGLLRTLLHNLNKGDVLLGDAFFPSYFLLWALQTMGVDCLCEQMGGRGRSTDFRKGKSLGPRDHLIVYSKPKIKPDWLNQSEYDAAPATVQVRELRVSPRKGVKGKTLVTTMSCPKAYKKGELKALYKDRWHVELNFRYIKTTLGMDVLSCRTPEMIQKEIWVYLLAYNLIRTLMAQAAVQAGCLPTELSFKHSIQLWLAWGRHGRVENHDDWIALMNAIGQKRVGNRPGRIEPRQKKRRPKPYPLMKKPRAAARRDVILHGHENKLAA